MPSYKQIVLVGPMGAGKSTIGRLLAKDLHLPFKDSDNEIEARCGADIPWIFDVEGEKGFRQRETAVLRELIQENALILATGGGIVLREENRDMLKKADAVIYLSATAEHLARRTAKDKKRPLLQVENPKEKIIQLLEERDALYREIATHVIITEAQNPKSVAMEIAKKLQFSASSTY